MSELIERGKGIVESLSVNDVGKLIGGRIELLIESGQKELEERRRIGLGFEGLHGGFESAMFMGKVTTLCKSIADDNRKKAMDNTKM